MKIKKILLIGIMILCLTGCTNVKDLSYDEIINMFTIKEKSPNVFKKGYQFYLPSGLIIDDSGSNYSIITSNNITFYLYVDLVSYLNGNKYDYKDDSSLVYSKTINYNKKSGFVQIKLLENNQYLIEIMYNYAKIEVMVEENLVNKALINSISVLNSIKYNDLVIERLLNDNDLSYTEEIFELFENENSNSNILEYEKVTEDEEKDDELVDTDFIN